MAHIAFFNIPADGHVNPTLPIVSELAARGHRISYAVDEDFASRVAAAGALPRRYDSTFPSARRGERYPLGDVVGMSSVFLDEAIAVLPQQAAAFQGDLPDLIIHDYASFPAQILQQRWAVPAIRTSPTRVPGTNYLDELRPVHDFFADDSRWLEYRRRFREFLDTNGVGMSIDEFTYVGMADRYLLTIPERFQVHPPMVGVENCTFVGPCIRIGNASGWRPPADGRPIMLISTGSIATELPELYSDCIEAFGGSDWHVIISIGHHVDPNLLGPVPGNIELHAEAPVIDILAHASLFLSHAGMGSTLEAMYFQVPTVAIPLGFDQMENARLIRDLGIGVSIPLEEVGPDRLRSAVDAVRNNPRIGERLATARAEAVAGGGARAAADLAEHCLQRSSAVERSL